MAREAGAAGDEDLPLRCGRGDHHPAVSVRVAVGARQRRLFVVKGVAGRKKRWPAEGTGRSPPPPSAEAELRLLRLGRQPPVEREGIASAADRTDGIDVDSLANAVRSAPLNLQLEPVVVDLHGQESSRTPPWPLHRPVLSSKPPICLLHQINWCFELDNCWGLLNSSSRPI